MVVTKRVLLIAKVCLEQKFMTLVQIGKKFFEKSQNVLQVPMKKVRAMVNAGYLRTVRLRVGEKRLYVTTKKGVQLLRAHNLSSSLRALEGVNDKTWEHDEIVTNVRIVFERLLGFTEWIPERVLKKKNVRKKVPDAIVSDGKKRFFIEVELNLKNKRYYERVFLDAYLKCGPKDVILYIMKNKTDMEWLMNRARSWQQIYFTTLDALQRISYGLEFINTAGDELYLERRYKGSVLFYDPEDPNRDITLDGSDEPEDEEFDRWLEEEEEAYRCFEEEERRAREQKKEREQREDPAFIRLI